jgi:cardiolipin synthase A/B
MNAVHLRARHHLHLLQGAKELFQAMVHAIEHSKHEVRLETYIFAFDEQGQAVAAALERAALRGVQVYLVVDGIGTAPLPPPWTARFHAAGVRWHRFSPLGWLGVFFPVRWRRLHRKLCVVDGRLAFCGGINVMDDFHDLRLGTLESARLDFAVQVQGPLVIDAQALMRRFWSRLDFARGLESRQWAKARSQWQTALRPQPAPMHAPAPDDAPGKIPAALVLRDNLRNRSRIEQTYRQAIGQAHHEVLIANAYFMPGRKLRRALEHAAQRGVRVVLLLQGRYEYFMQFHGARAVYGSLLAAGVEIHEYQGGFLHAKVAVVDGVWATVGSSNLEPLSLLLAREANVVLRDVQFAQELRERLHHAIEQQSVQMDPLRYAQRGRWQRALDLLALLVLRIGLFVVGRRY